MSPSEIIRRQAEQGAQRAQERATHVWPRAKRATPPAPPPPPEPDQPIRTPPVTPVTRDMTFNPDHGAIDAAYTVTTTAPTAAPTAERQTIADKILQALNQQPGRWFTAHELSIMTATPRGTLARALTRLCEQMPNDIVRVEDGKSYRYRLLNSTPTRGKK